MKLEELKDKKILILGLGKEGIDTLKFLRKLLPDKVLGVADAKKDLRFMIYDLRKDKRIRFHLGENYLGALKNYDVIIKSPGVPIHFPEVERSLKEGKITSQTEIFFENCPGEIIGITGTKGKSTTTSLIYGILREGGLKAHLVGNIGKPVLSLLSKSTPKDIYVYELSSHQLQNLKQSPNVAVFLNLFPEHLDYYKDFNEYLRAKKNIARYQRKEDYFVFNPKDKNVRATAKISRGKKLPIDVSGVKKIISQKEIPLKGDFYLENIAAAIEVARIFRIPQEKIKKAIKNFKPLSHRLEFVGTFKGITFYNDSLSTIPETTIAALNSLGKKVQTLFLGGFDRGLSFKKLAQKILKNKIRTLILFPTTGEKIWRETINLKKENNLKAFLVSNMRDAVKLALKYTKRGEICLLSPASPSFGLFKNYKERGNLFKKYVRLYGKKKI